MNLHHEQSIEKFINLYNQDPTILAILLGGSIAHGFAKPESDIDIIIVVEESEYQKRKNENKLAFSLWDICTYPGGYIDCKVVSLSFMNTIIDKGSDPSRYAFQDSEVLWSRIDNLPKILEQIARFPTEDQTQRRVRFASQLLAWKWYYSEAVKKQNQYLKYLSIQKLILFACRLVLNENQMLYPYHKWLLNVVNSAPHKPNDFDKSLELLLAQHTQDDVVAFCNRVLLFAGLDEPSLDWPNHFLHDSELNWLEHEPPIDDL